MLALTRNSYGKREAAKSEVLRHKSNGDRGIDINSGLLDVTYKWMVDNQ